MPKEQYRNLNSLLTTWRGNRVLMTIFPHPDDETMATGGLLIAAKKAGWQTIVVVLTAGEAGKINIHPRGRSTKQIRSAELDKATKILGVSELIMADFGDAKLRGQEKKLEKYLGEVVEKYQPGLIVSYDHSGFTGHPDHITVSRVVKKVVGLSSRHSSNDSKTKLLWVTLPEKFASKMHPEIQAFRSMPNYLLDMGLSDLVTKYRAAKVYKSQRLSSNPFLPVSLLLLATRAEWYYEVDLSKSYPYRYFDFQI